LAASLCETAEAGGTPPSADVAVSEDTGAVSSREPSGASCVVQVKQSSCRPERYLQDLPATDSSSRPAQCDTAKQLGHKAAIIMQLDLCTSARGNPTKYD